MVSECSEFHNLGEFHEGIETVDEAIKLYNQIPPERMSAVIQDYLVTLVIIFERHERWFRNILLEKSHYEIVNMEYAELQYKISLHFYQMLKKEYKNLDLDGYSFIYNLLMGLLLQYIINKEYFIENTDEVVLNKYRNEIVLHFTEVVEDYVKRCGG